MTVVDAHHHLWDPSLRAYPWLDAEPLAPIRRRYGLPDLRAHAEAAGVERTVLVQTVADVEETRAFLAQAEASGGLIAGVVGWVDLCAPDVGDVIAELREGRGGEHLVGVRHQVQDEPDPGWILRPEVVRGLRAVAAAGLVYDLLVVPHQLPSAVAAVQQVPDGRFVLDHAAKPEIATGAREPWATDLRRLAAHEHVTCKLSGLVTEAEWARWALEDLRPYADVVLDAFGATRTMAGSDWPVCELAATYAEVWGVARTLTGHLTAAEQADVLGGTAVRTYDLDRRGP